jgi:energy-coupling factor transporter ATP-binding protein EcfA2
MRKLQLKYFKAFKDELTIDFSNKNFLLYGENGSGKSSIFEALRVVFFRSDIEKSIPNAPTQEEQVQITKDFWAKYNNKIVNQQFEIRINDVNYNGFSTTNYQSFMISLENIVIGNNIKFNSLLENFSLDISNINTFCNSHCQEIQDNVNNTLVKFNENFTIEIDIEDDFTIKIIDVKRRLESKTEIKKFFNEAKLNLVVLLLIFNSIKKAQVTSKTKVLILDDFITSLDASNRTFLLKYIFENFSKFQILIFTHNVSFYNLVMYMSNKIYRIKESWLYANIYEIKNSSKLYIKIGIEKADAIRISYENIPSGNNLQQIEDIGNRIRQKFEILLYELSKLIMIGAVEDSKTILERIENSKNIYYNNNKTASDLVDEIILVLNKSNKKRLRNRLFATINEYKHSDFINFKHLLRELTLYQKVTMHPMSHGTIGQSSFTTNEIEKSIELLVKLESRLKDFVDSNVDCV